MTGKIFVAVLLCIWADVCFAHGRLKEPPGRSSMWRYGFKTPPNYDDNQLFCGGFNTQWNENGGKCGICGDNYADPQPRANEAGGKYGNGIIVRTYTKGQTVRVTVELTAIHNGWMEFKLCPNNNVKKIATHACLDQHVLQRADKSGTKTIVKGQQHIYHIDLKLPAGLVCSQCVMQWRYHAGNSWGCGATGGCCVGCGPQEEFYGCADVAITANGVIHPVG